jgi:hypothetical protein
MKTLRPLFLSLVLSLVATAACSITCPAPVITLPQAAASADSPEQAGAQPGSAPSKLGALAKAAGRTDKGTTGHNYVEVYERFILQWKNDPIKIFEIGIESGGSLLMWQEYFPKAKIFAVDIVDKAAMSNTRVKTIVGDQSKRADLQKAIDISGGDIDILIDDGGHSMEQQQVSLAYLFKFVKPGGYYILEDIHTSLPALWNGYGVDPDGKNTTLGMIQNYMLSAPPVFKSKYMQPDEIAYLNEQVEYANLLYRAPDRSITCIFKKKAK